MSETQYLITICGGLFAISSALLIWAFNRLDKGVTATRVDLQAARNEVNNVHLEVAELRGMNKERAAILDVIRESLRRDVVRSAAHE